jgi:hypothetical protein
VAAKKRKKAAKRVAKRRFGIKPHKGTGKSPMHAMYLAANKQTTSAAARKKIVSKRTELHKAASLLKSFHGGHLPLKSGCGRPPQSGPAYQLLKQYMKK